MCVALLVLFVGLVNSQKVAVDSYIDYHELVGIPEAARIKAGEKWIRYQRIVGGAPSDIISHPYLAGLVISVAKTNRESVCGASLVSANRLVTAGHCWAGASSFVVVLGSKFLFTGGTRITTSTVFPHRQYNPYISLIMYDVAVIYLPTNVAFSAYIQPVALPSSQDMANRFVGYWATAVGYGKTSDLEASVSFSTFRREVTLQVIDNAQCREYYGSAALLDSNICTNGAGGVGICGGDSGGPLTLVSNGRRILVGVSSFAAAKGCHLRLPSAFARITSFYGFIRHHL